MSPHPLGTSVTILGSGTCVPSLQRSACAVLVETGHTKLLLDAGPGTMRRLLEAGTTIFDLSYLLLSHFHPDHTGELVPLLFATKYPERSRRKKLLTILAGRGFINFFNNLKSVYGSWIELAPEILRLTELDNSAYDQYEGGDFRLETRPVQHSTESIAYRITGADGRSVVYSGDTDVSKNLALLARNADVLICESALPDEMKVKGHLTPSLAGEIASKANVGKLVLTHFYPECETVDLAKQCRKTYDGPLVLAKDLMRFEL